MSTIRVGIDDSLRHPSEEKDVFKVGLELEYVFAPSTLQLARFHLSTNTTIPLVELEDYLASRLGKRSPFILQVAQEKFQKEFIYRPSSLKALYTGKEQLKELLLLLQAVGFIVHNTQLQSSGLHISLDRKEISPELLSKVVDWIFYNDLFFLLISGRKQYATREADMQFLLGNHYRNWSTEEIISRYNRAKANLTVAYAQRRFAQILNIRVYSDREYIHFGHFASTVDVNELFTRIEFIVSIFEFVKQNSSNDLKEFDLWVTANRAEYPHLHKEMAYLIERKAVLNKAITEVSYPMNLLLPS
jgi:hypothetical protein